MSGPQIVICKATFSPTGQTEPVPAFGDPMVLPDVAETLKALGWLDPTAAARIAAVAETIEKTAYPDRILISEGDQWLVILRKAALELRRALNGEGKISDASQ